jgi:hypothetical protein
MLVDTKDPKFTPAIIYAPYIPIQCLDVVERCLLYAEDDTLDRKHTPITLSENDIRTVLELYYVAQTLYYNKNLEESLKLATEVLKSIKKI